SLAETRSSIKARHNPFISDLLLFAEISISFFCKPAAVRSLLIPVFRVAFENLLGDHPDDKQHLIDRLGELKIYSNTGQRIGTPALPALPFHKKLARLLNRFLPRLVEVRIQSHENIVGLGLRPRNF